MSGVSLLLLRFSGLIVKFILDLQKKLGLSLLKTTAILHAEQLTKRFSSRRGWRGWLRGSSKAPLTVVDAVDLTLQRGEIFGLMGLNGAGKTTLVRMLCGLLPPNAGCATVLGFDVVRQASAVRAAVGLLSGDDRSFYWRLTARQNLLFFAELYGLTGEAGRRRSQELLALFELGPVAHCPVSQLSSGMRQRLSLARALLHSPKILFLDEPTRALDVQAAEMIWRILKDQLVAQRGMTIFFTTHQVHEAEQMCHRVGILHQGRLLAAGDPAELKGRFGLQPRYRVELQGLTPEAAQELNRLSPALVWEEVQGTTILEFEPQPQLTLDELLRRCHDLGAQIAAVEYKLPSMAEVLRQVAAASGLPASARDEVCH